MIECDHDWITPTARYGTKPIRRCRKCYRHEPNPGGKVAEPTRADIIRLGLPAPRTEPGDTCRVCHRDHSTLEANGLTAEKRWRLADQVCFQRSILGNEKHDYEWKYLRRKSRGLDFTEYGDHLMNPRTGTCPNCGANMCGCGNNQVETLPMELA